MTGFPSSRSMGDPRPAPSGGASQGSNENEKRMRLPSHIHIMCRESKCPRILPIRNFPERRAMGSVKRNHGYSGNFYPLSSALPAHKHHLGEVLRENLCLIPEKRLYVATITTLERC